MKVKNNAKRRDPEVLESAPVDQSKANRSERARRESPLRSQYSRRNNNGKPTVVEQMRSEPLLQQRPRTTTTSKNQDRREPVEYYPRSSSPRYAVTISSYQPPCPIVAMPLNDTSATTTTTTTTGNQTLRYVHQPEFRAAQASSQQQLNKYEPVSRKPVKKYLSKSSRGGYLQQQQEDQQQQQQAASVTTSTIRQQPQRQPSPIVTDLDDEIFASRSMDSRDNQEFADFINADSDFGTTSQKTDDDEDVRDLSTNETNDTTTLEEQGLGTSEHYKSMSTDGTECTEITDETYLLLSRQKYAYATMILVGIQMTILIIQICLCGMAPLEINPVVGPYPDAFSEWGGKNAYLMMEGKQYFRFLTPAFLHVGILHFILNTICTLRSAAIFEQEWGSVGWITAYILSTIGAVAVSCVVEPNEIGVSSSGALMGLFGAKVAQFIAYSCFELHSVLYLDAARSQVTSVLCNTIVVFLLCFVTYIDQPGHLGGFLAGLFSGMLLFCRAIKSRCTRFVWSFTGLLGLVCGALILTSLLLFDMHADEELGDACQYFRILYQEGYDCECKWQ